MRHERAEGRDREAESEPAVWGPAAEDAEANREAPNPDDNDATTTRRGSSSERTER